MCITNMCILCVFVQPNIGVYAFIVKKSLHVLLSEKLWYMPYQIYMCNVFVVQPPATQRLLKHSRMLSKH